MQQYTLKAGREGLLVRPNGDVEPFTATKDLTFDRDDIVMDPVRLYNDTHQGMYKPPNTNFQHVSEKLAKQGYTVFGKMGGRGIYRWGFAVHLKAEDQVVE